MYFIINDINELAFIINFNTYRRAGMDKREKNCRMARVSKDDDGRLEIGIFL